MLRTPLTEPAVPEPAAEPLVAEPSSVPEPAGEPSAAAPDPASESEGNDEWGSWTRAGKRQKTGHSEWDLHQLWDDRGRLMNLGKLKHVLFDPGGGTP